MYRPWIPVIFCFLYFPIAQAIVLVSNFDDDRALYSGGFGFGAIRAGEVCCPRTIDPNFVEQSAQSFTLTSAARVHGFELVLFQFRGDVNSLNVYLTRASATNPGGSSREIGYLAPDLDQVIESWHFEDVLPATRTLLAIDSILEPILPPNEMFWLTLTPGREVLTGEIIDIGWVTGDIPLDPPSIFANRNNAVGGPIDDIVWTAGSGQFLPHQAGYTLRVQGTPIPAPSTFALLFVGLVGIGLPLIRRLFVIRPFSV